MWWRLGISDLNASSPCVVWIYLHTCTSEGNKVKMEQTYLSLCSMSRDPNFGKYPISDRMRPRYIQALESVLRVLENPSDLQKVLPEHFSEVKGMFNRCIRCDQWDWQAVHIAFGRPSRQEVKRLIPCFTEAAQALRRQQIGSIQKILLPINTTIYRQMLRDGLQHIVDTTPRLPERRKNSEQINSNHFVERNNTLVDDVADLYVISEKARTKIDVANATHKNTLFYSRSFCE